MSHYPGIREEAKQNKKKKNALRSGNFSFAMNFWFILLWRGANRLLGSESMPDSSSEDQLDAGVLSGEQPSCSAALTTCEKYIRVCWRGGMFQRAVYEVSTLQNITQLGRACHISTLWHLECLQEGGESWWGLRRQKKNTLQEDYAATVPSLFQEFVMLN